MKLNKIAALVLAGALCLSTCTGCGAKAEDTIATLGNETVSYGVANFIVKYQKASMDDMYAMYATYYGVDSLWGVDLSGSGVTAEEELKSTAMKLVHEMYTLKAHMADYGVEITAEDEAAIKEAANAFLAANTAEAIEEFGATEEIVTEVLTLYTIQAKMYDAIIVDTDCEVSDEEANMRGYSMIYMDLTGHYDDDSKWVEYTEEEIADLKSKALEMNLDLKVKSMEDVAEANGYDVNKSAYKKADETLEPEVLKALDALAEGEVSESVETEDGIYFLRVDADVDKEATDKNRASIIADREYALYEEVVKKWQENDGWDLNESMVDKIEFHNMFTQYKDTESESEAEKEESTENLEETTENDGVSETVDGE